MKTIAQAIVDNGDIPIASEETLGGVMVGDGLSITDAGVLSASGGGEGGFAFVKMNGIVDLSTHSVYPTDSTLDHTFGEIKAMVESGLHVICEVTVDATGDSVKYLLPGVWYTGSLGDSSLIEFSGTCVQWHAGGAYILCISYTSTDEVTINSSLIQTT